MDFGLNRAYRILYPILAIIIMILDIILPNMEKFYVTKAIGDF